MKMTTKVLLVQGYLALVPAHFWQWFLDLQKDNGKQTLKIPLGKDYGSTFQNLKITEFTVCLTYWAINYCMTTQYYRTRPSNNFETVNLEIPNSKSLKTQTLSKLGIRYSDDLMILFVWSNTTALKDGSFEFYFFTFDFIN